MPTPWLSRAGLLALAGAAAAAFALLGAGGSVGGEAAAPAGSWRTLLGGAEPDLGLGQRAIVLLKAPSLAQRVAKAGGIASTADERRWTAAAYAAQQQLILRLAVQGIAIKPEYAFARVLDGFSARLGAAAVAALERSKEVAGVYPVRAAFPAAISRATLDRVASGGSSDVRLPGYDGHGIMIALLDTGVDRAHPFLRGRVLPGIDVLRGARTADAAADPIDPALVERHGTELAGLLVGGGGPAGLQGVATGATVLPIRVAGWQPDARGGYAVYARGDQLIAGLERAVDPNGDGDAHDAARVALIGLAERYAGFADSPEARAVDGALALDTLVVTPAGNDGGAGPGYGSVAGPGGAEGALTVGATDERPSLGEARLVLRRGLQVLFDGEEPLLGAVGLTHPLDLVPASPRPSAPRSLADFFDPQGFSLVAGKAAVVEAGSDPAAAARRAAQAGAAAVLLYGARVPAGALGLDESVGVPVLGVPAGPALALLASARLGVDAGISIGPAPARPNPDAGRVAAFSSRGLAFDGRVEPDLVAPGVGLATAEPGTAGAGGPRYATVNGSSASAALAAGAAALLAQERPRLDAPSLRSLLVGYSRRIAGDAVTAQGAGALDLGAAAVGEVAASPAALAFGGWTGSGWSATETLTLRNVSTRRLSLSLSPRTEGGEPEAAAIRVEPARLVLPEGATRRVTVTARVSAAPVGAVGSGSIEVRAGGGRSLRIPWAIDYRPYRGSLIGAVALSARSFAPSDRTPARLTVHVGAVVGRGGSEELEPASRLDVQLWRADGRGLGLLARVRDLLPGRYTFGLTGRDPRGRRLRPGRYRIRLVAWPTRLGKPSVRSVSFTVE